MNNTELANFKKKLSIELETTTSDEAQLISNIVDSASAGALPAVSADDNGKVLTVSSGAWAAAQPSGGGGIIKFVANDDNTFENTIININGTQSQTTVYVLEGVDEWDGTPICPVGELMPGVTVGSVSIMGFLTSTQEPTSPTGNYVEGNTPVLVASYYNGDSFGTRHFIASADSIKQVKEE